MSTIFGFKSTQKIPAESGSNVDISEIKSTQKIPEESGSTGNVDVSEIPNHFFGHNHNGFKY
jgi:hypothetical protein